MGAASGKNSLRCLTCMTKQMHCFVLVNAVLKRVHTEVEGCCYVPVLDFFELFLTVVIGRLFNRKMLTSHFVCLL